MVKENKVMISGTVNESRTRVKPKGRGDVMKPITEIIQRYVFQSP